jgi:hypothetical protein
MIFPSGNKKLIGAPVFTPVRLKSSSLWIVKSNYDYAGDFIVHHPGGCRRILRGILPAVFQEVHLVLRKSNQTDRTSKNTIKTAMK